MKKMKEKKKNCSHLKDESQSVGDKRRHLKIIKRPTQVGEERHRSMLF